MNETKLIFLIGMPASGKSTLGRLLAEKLKWEFVDLDFEIEREQGKSIADIFRDEGEDVFRKVEDGQLRSLVGTATTSTIVANGGGTPCFFDNMAFMLKIGIVIWVNTPLAIIQQRLADKEIKKRPLLASHGDKKEYVNELWDKRKTYYQEAHLVVDPSSDSMDEIISKILEAYTGSKHSPDIT